VPLLFLLVAVVVLATSLVAAVLAARSPILRRWVWVATVLDCSLIVPSTSHGRDKSFSGPVLQRIDGHDDRFWNQVFKCTTRVAEVLVCEENGAPCTTRTCDLLVRGTARDLVLKRTSDSE
jgi:hypothetical protein